MRKLWLVQFVANALIIYAFYEWLGVRDSRVSQLLISFLLGAAIVAGTVFLHSRTFNMKPWHFALCFLIFGVVCLGLYNLPLDKAGLWVASTLTHAIRKPVKPATVTSVFDAIRWFIQWIIVPLLLLRNRCHKFWMKYAAIVLVAFLVPSFLIHWTPKLTSTGMQVTSFVLRFGIAYCLVTTGFVAFWRLTSSGSPVESQPTTAALP